MVHVREMTEADVDAVSAIRVGGWRYAYAGIVPQPYLDGMSVEEDARLRRAAFARPRPRSASLVAVAGEGPPVGWASVGPCRDEDAGPDTGEVYALYLRPDLVGTGAGRALLEGAHARAAREGFTAVALWVLTGNARARRFYERAGYEADGGVQSDLYGEVALEELRYRITI